jgi:hypothetical protein
MSLLSALRVAEGALLEIHIPARLEFAMVDSVEEMRFIALGEDGVAPWLCYPRGVAFSGEAELRWVRRQAGDWHLVLLSDRGGSLSGAEHCSAVEMGAESTIILRGTRQAGGLFEEGRIPGAIAYPFEPADNYAKMKVRHYSVDGRTFSRLVEPL